MADTSAAANQKAKRNAYREAYRRAAAAASGTRNNRNNRNNGNNGNNRNTQYNKYVEAEPYMNGNRPANKNWRLRFANTRTVRPINKVGLSKALETRHKTRTRRHLQPHFPDETNLLSINQKSSYASRVASESARLHAEHATVQEMLSALNARPMNARVKEGVRKTLRRKFYNLTGPMPARLPQPLPRQPAGRLYQSFGFSAASEGSAAASEEPVGNTAAAGGTAAAPSPVNNDLYE